MSIITDRIKLLSLVLQTLPFEYNNNKVTASYELYIEVSELSELKQSVEHERDRLDENQKTDDMLRNYNENLYLIDRIIQELQSK